MNLVFASRNLQSPMPTAPAFARTYRARDGWDRVLEYQKVQNYVQDHPDQGSHAVSTTLGLPRSRIRSWVDDDDKAPDPVHGLRVAYGNEWFVPEYDARRRSALAVCVAWIFAGGSITKQHFRPRFSTQGDDEKGRIEKATSTLGVELKYIDRSAEGQGVEAEPAENASVFGRILVAAGAPTDEEDVFPGWIHEEPFALQREVVAVYLECRGHLAGEAEILQIKEDARPQSHLESVGELLVRVAGRGSFTVKSQHLRLDQDATDAILDEICVDV